MTPLRPSLESPASLAPNGSPSTVGRLARSASLVAAAALLAGAPAVHAAATAAPAKAPAAKAAQPPAPAQNPGRVNFLEGVPFADVLKKATAAGKPLFVDMYAVWCGPCKLMDQTVFADPTVADWMRKNAIPVRYDAEKGEGLRLSRRFAVSSFPTFLILDEKGNEIDRLLGAHDSGRFLELVKPMFARTSNVPAAYAKLQKEWDEQTALVLVQALAQRNDLARMGPLVRRIVQDDPDLAKPTTLEAFGLFVALEDWGGRLSPDSVDLIATYLPRLGAEPRRALLGVLLARQMVREEDAQGARKVCEETLLATGPSSGFASDLEATAAAALRIEGRPKEAAAALRRAIPLAEPEGKPAGVRAAYHASLADALAASGDAAGARAELAKSAELGGREASTLAREARARLRLKETAAAVETARRAVEMSRGEDAEAQAALGVALAAAGDHKGAVEALSHAVAIDPRNPGFRRELDEAKKKR